MAEYISKEAAVDDGYLSDWYIASVGNEPPVWTDAHIDELLNDFIVIPKDTKAADVQPDSYVNAIYTELAELFGSPCNFSPMDEFMLESGKCQNCCGDIPESECWKRYFEMKLKQ